MTREITHMKAFTRARWKVLEKPAFAIGRIAPTAGLVDQFFNESTGEGDYGDIDARGPWNEGEDWQFVQFKGAGEVGETEESPPIYAESSDLEDAEPIKALLVDQLQDIQHAEKQLLKALPKMAEAARSDQLSRLLNTHLAETEAQVERLGECFKLLGKTGGRAKPCKGMMGIVEEGQEVMDKGKKMDDASADLALIGAAQRVEHYEIAGYTTAKNLAQQIHNSAVAQLLTKSLGEEENADQLLDQLARSFMSVARMPASVE